MVLMKTFHFMKSLPSFQHLPVNDRLILLHNRWVPLFILGLAQERFSFEVWDFPAASILRNILLNSPERNHRYLPTLAEVSKLKSFLNTLWSLDPSLKEYAYIKGAILFNPGVLGCRPARSLLTNLFIRPITGQTHLQELFNDVSE
ncbi:nuclear receptor subfamily 0, group B, member 2b [Misgurnus anguillicaudatus]|uniref:nuclear receptor subfamily 0, group B, member 2b n=1 Tax=Misgurnus anguillicaudatus TaxID=75329 RepID=UPI003CCFC876